MFFLKKLKNRLLDILFPALELLTDIKINRTLFCSTCRARLADNKKICHKSAQYLLGAATDYNDHVKKLIWRLKYRDRAGFAEPLAQLLARYLEILNLEIEAYIVIPAPLSQKRFRERGYNQAELIAKIVAEKFNLPMETGALIRQKHTPPQAEVRGWDERKKNIAGCFGVTDPNLIKGKNIILVDDVFTSGATMSEAVHQLKDFGAKKILGLVIAKAG